MRGRPPNGHCAGVATCGARWLVGSALICSAACGRLGFETIDPDAAAEAGFDAGDAMATDASDTGDAGNGGDATISDAGDAGGPTAIHVVPNETLLSTGAMHTCAGLYGRVYCWGDNAFGQLGDRTILDRSAPVAIGSIRDVVDLQLGEEHSCAMTTIGAIQCWGRNDRGQLGDGTGADQDRPVFVRGLEQGARSLWVGPFHNCARAADGRILCWGRNDHGQLGDGTLSTRNAPVPMMNAANIDSLLLGADMTCAVMSDRTVTCRGYNVMGQLGAGSTADSDQITPVEVNGVARVRQATSGYQHACALLDSGEVRCWGDNRRFQAGNDSTNTSEPTAVSVATLIAARSITASEHTSCAVDETGVAKCWGASVAGSAMDRRIPTTLGTLIRVREVHAGRAHQCMRVVSNYVHCVGDNSEGQLGDGSRVTSATTVQVLGLPAPVSGVTPTCGDRFINNTELCDDGTETARCNADCTLSSCGDGVLNVSAGETCESPGDLDAGGCLPDCTLP